MTTNAKALAAWWQAQAYLEEMRKRPMGTRELSPRLQYVLRRIMGPAELTICDEAFVQAWNESPIVDADEDESFFADILVRPHEPKDGVR